MHLLLSRFTLTQDMPGMIVERDPDAWILAEPVAGSYQCVGTEQALCSITHV
jgi:hypothetical protein